MFMFNILQFIFPIMFILVFGVIIFSIIKGIGQWSNNRQPVLSVKAKVVANRAQTSYNTSLNDNQTINTHFKGQDIKNLKENFNMFITM